MSAAFDGSFDRPESRHASYLAGAKNFASAETVIRITSLTLSMHCRVYIPMA